MTALPRRTLLKSGVAVLGGTLAGGPFHALVATQAHGARRRRPVDGYGRLSPVRDHRDGAVRLLLPRGFNYRSFDVAGERMSDATPVPTNHDGMACFPGRNASHYVLVRNHEINGPVGAFGDPATAYDPMAGGGCTRIAVSRHGKVSHNEVALNGTQMNCAGGPMPWGSWVTCQETVNGPDVGDDFTGQDNDLLRRRHGYVFEVPAHGSGAADTDPVRSAGRFAHEAAAYDPHTAAIYLTEDNFAFPSGFYRYLAPSDPMATGRVLDGGVLEMLRVPAMPNADLSGAVPVGSSYDVDWVLIAEPDPDFPDDPEPTNDEAIVAVGDQGRAQGAAVFARLEGAAWDDGIVYFCSTQGGTPDPRAPQVSGFGDGRGQIWAYDPRVQQLTLLYESPSFDVLDLPDNIAVSRRGTLVLCEDDGNDANLLRGLTVYGSIFDFAQNAIAGLETEEFAGSTFSPDGHTLFVNIQTDERIGGNSAMTFAIWGPWARGPF